MPHPPANPLCCSTLSMALTGCLTFPAEKSLMAGNSASVSSGQESARRQEALDRKGNEEEEEEDMIVLGWCRGRLKKSS